MKRWQIHNKKAGVSLVELMVATSLMATLMASTVVLTRSSRNAWQAHRDDVAVAESAYALARHIVRVVRQADDVTSITGPADSAGALTVLLESGNSITYQTSGTDVIYSDSAVASNSLAADQITGLTFIGYQADGTTATTTVDEIQAIESIIDFTMPSGTNRTIRTFTWVRSW